MSTQDQYQRFLNFLKEDANNIELLTNTANLASELGHYTEAIALADRGLALDQKHQDLLFTKALASLSSGDIDQAQSLFQQLVDDGHDDPTLRYNLAYCLALKEQYEQVLPVLEGALEHYEALPQMLLLKMRALYELGELEAAAELGKEALEINTADGAVHELMSSLYIDLSDFTNAQHHAAQALQTNPNLGLAHTSMGTVALNMQDDATAITRFDDALRINNQDGRAWLGKAMAQMLQQNLPLAETSFMSAIQFMPTHLGTYQALAWCQIYQQKLSEAEDTTKQAMAIDDTFSENHGTLAVLSAMRGDIESAKKLSRTALGLDKASFSGLYSQALILQAEGNAKLAQKIIDGILDAPNVLENSSLRQYIEQYVQKNSPKAHQTKH